MAIHFACACGREFHVQAKRAGRAFTCPSCGAHCDVPHASTLPSPRSSPQHDAPPKSRNPPKASRPSPPAASDDVEGGVSPEDLVVAGLIDANDPGLRLQRREAERRGPPPEERDPDDPLHQAWTDPYLEAEARAGRTPAPPPRRRTPRSRSQRIAIRLIVIMACGGVAIGVALMRRPLMEQRHTRAMQLNEEALVLYENDSSLGWQDTARAIELEKKAIRLSPQFFEAHFNIGNMYNLRNQHRDAMQAYERAVTLRPDHVEANIGLGISYFKTRRFADAKATLTAALALDPQNADGHLYMAYTLYQTAEYDAAWEQLKTARDLGAHFHAAFAEKLQRARTGHPDVERAW